MSNKGLRCRAAAGSIPSLAIERLINSAMPVAADPAPRNRNRWSASFCPVRRNAAKMPAKTAKTTALEGPVDLNRAGLAELQRLPGIGPKLAQRIVDVRTTKPFTTVDEIRRVPGIGVKTLEKIRPHATVEAKATGHID